MYGRAVDDRTADQEWVKERIKAVSERYDVFDALIECGVELGERDMTTQIQCPLPGHGPDNRPSARYYAADGSGPAHFYCFKCKINHNGISMMAALRGMEFMRALAELEHRFSIKTPRRPEVSIGVPEDKSGAYESEAWADVPRVLAMLETKLVRLRDKTALLDYVKWCRVIDAVRWDLDHCGGVANPNMVSVLMKLKIIMGRAGHADI
jgi:hypothetical protein